MGHHQRVGTQLLEEVALDRHAFGTQDVSQHLGENAFGPRRGAWPIRNHRRSRSHLATSFIAEE